MGERHSDDPAVIERAQRGDLVAFETLYGVYRGRIAAHLCRLVDDADLAADLTQDVFVRAFRAIGRTQPGLNLKAWLFAIATNLAMSHHRHRRVIHWISLDVWREEVPTTGPEECVAARSALAAALAALPRDQADCFLLWAREGFCYEEIASGLGITPGAAKTRVYRARLALARTLREREDGT